MTVLDGPGAGCSVRNGLTGAAAGRPVGPAPHAGRWAARPMATQRPGGRPLSYADARAPVRLSRASHRPTPAQVRLRVLVCWLAVGVLSLAAVAGLVALRSAGTVEVPTATAVVQVRPGESLSELAARAAPGAPTSAVVERIVLLNGLSGAAVRPGEALVVPVG